MTSLSDTCVLSRAGMAGLQAMQQGACEVLAAGGCASFAGRAARPLDAIMLALNARREAPPISCRHPVSRQSCRLTHSEDVMEQITLSFPASRALSGRALAGVVGSGDMEVLYTAAQSATLNVQITTSVDNSRALAGAVRQVEPDQRPARRAVDYPRLRRHAGRRPYSY